MAVTILDVDSTTFSIDGVKHLKNFLSTTANDNLRIVNAYDSNLTLVPYTPFGDFLVGGAGFGSVALLQAALLNVLYTRATLGGGGGSGTVTSVAVSGSDGLEVDSGSPITTSGTIALGLNKTTTLAFLNVEDGAEVNDVDSVNGLTGVVVLDEEAIDGNAKEDATMTGAENVDLDLASDSYYTLTGNTTISVSNLPASGKAIVRSWTFKSSAAETLTLPGTWIVIGSYLATGVENYLTIRFSNYPVIGAKVVCYINQDD